MKAYCVYLDGHPYHLCLDLETAKKHAHELDYNNSENKAIDITEADLVNECIVLGKGVTNV